MSISDRRHRERAQRHDLIIAAARDLADGVAKAGKALDDGAVRATLDRLVRASNA